VGRKSQTGVFKFRPVWTKSNTPVSKIARAIKDRCVTQVVHHLPSKHEVLNSNTSHRKKKTNRRKALNNMPEKQKGNQSTCLALR
jgi:hypothetical protein